jgi:hypothetical protein
VRAEPPRLLERHPRRDPERARFVGCRRDHAPTRRIPTHDHRLADEVGMVRLLDGGKERVHVDEEDHGSPAMLPKNPGPTLRVGTPGAREATSEVYRQILRSEERPSNAAIGVFRQHGHSVQALLRIQRGTRGS